MAAINRWKQAWIGAVSLHMVLFASAGWLSAMAFVLPPARENYLELALIDLGGSSVDLSPPAASAPVGQQVSQVPNDLPARETNTAAQVVIPVVELPVIAASTAAAVNLAAAIEASEAGNSFTGSGIPDGGNGIQRRSGGAASGGENSGRGGIAAPGILDRVEPEYPKQARRAGWEGTVVLKIQIMENGRPGNIDVASSSGYQALDEAAVSAVERWRFVPAKDRASGQAVSCYTTMPIAFKLRV